MTNTNIECLYNLNFLYNAVENALRSRLALYSPTHLIDNELQNDLDAVFISFILVYTNSFLDEWKLLGKEYKEIRKICAPATKKIEAEWPDIKTLRNQVLTHNHRDKDDKSIHFTGSWLNYRVPLGIIELELLVYLLGLVVEATNKISGFNFNDVLYPTTGNKSTAKWISEKEANEIKETVKNQMNLNIVKRNAAL